MVKRLSEVLAAAWGLHLHGLPRTREAAPGSIFAVMQAQLTEKALEEGKREGQRRAGLSIH